MNDKNLQKENKYYKYDSFFSFSSINKEFDKKKIIEKINHIYENKIGLDKLELNDHAVLKEAIDY